MLTTLALGILDPEPSVMRLLPPDIAYRYHALPVATDGQQVTVAISVPDDQGACEVIQAVIDAPVCFIQADPEDIDRRLEKLWPVSCPKPRILLWNSGIEEESFFNFSRSIAELLGADLEQVDIPISSLSPRELAAVVNEREPDLFIYSDCHPARMMRKLIREAAKNIGRLSYLIVPCAPVLPISKILLILPDRGEGSDLAIVWAGKLASSNHIQVTVLPVLPPVPVFYGSFLQHSLPEILAGNDPLGHKLRAISHQFNDNDVVGIYKLREGDPASQVREEIFTSDPDLIIIPSCLGTGLNNWTSADLGMILFKSVSKPLLLTLQD